MNDDGLLLRMFRVCCEPYRGPALTLYRGDGEANYRAGNIGFSWSTSKDWARMHATRFAVGGTAGIIVAADAAPAAIICNLPPHIGEREHIVDVSRLDNVRIVARITYEV